MRRRYIYFPLTYFHNSSKKEHITKYSIKSTINSTEAKIKLISKYSTRTANITVKIKIKHKKYHDYAKALHKFSTYFHNSSKKVHITKYSIKSTINSTEAKIKLSFQRADSMFSTWLLALSFLMRDARASRDGQLAIL